MDDVRATARDDDATLFLQYSDKTYKTEDINHNPSRLRYFGIDTTQHQDFTVEANAEDMLCAIAGYCTTAQLCKQLDYLLKSIEKVQFASINSSIGWVGTAAFALCSFCRRYLQQKALLVRVSLLVNQSSVICRQKKFGIVTAYSRTAW